MQGDIQQQIEIYIPPYTQQTLYGLQQVNGNHSKYVYQNNKNWTIQ